jgi:hypothetical protein
VFSFRAMSFSWDHQTFTLVCHHFWRLCYPLFGLLLLQFFGIVGVRVLQVLYNSCFAASSYEKLCLITLRTVWVQPLNLDLRRESAQKCAGIMRGKIHGRRKGFVFCYVDIKVESCTGFNNYYIDDLQKMVSYLL